MEPFSVTHRDVPVGLRILFQVDTDSEPDIDTDDPATFNRGNNPQIGTDVRQLL